MTHLKITSAQDESQKEQALLDDFAKAAMQASMSNEDLRKPRTFREDVSLTTKSGKPVWVTHCCELTKRYHGLYLNRDNVWVATSWDENGVWQKFDSSMDIEF